MMGSTSSDDSFKRKGSHLEQRERLGLLSSDTKAQANHRHYSSETSSALQKVEVCCPPTS